MPATVIRRPGRRLRRWLAGLLGVIVALTVLAVVDVAVLWSRFQQIATTMPATSGPQTWVIVGLDDREDVSPEVGQYTDDPDKQPGTRADIVIVVTRMPDAIRAMSLPRDLLLGQGGRDGNRNRLANHWQIEPQQFVDMMCTELNIPTDHVVSVNMQALVEVVDALGGVEVEVPYPLWDGAIVLDAGVQTLDGITALAYARSRLGAAFLDGQWVPEPDGDAMRQIRTSQVLQGAIAKLKAQPWRAQAVAWSAAPHVGVDSGSNLADLLPLLQLDGIQSVGMNTAPGSYGSLTVEGERAIAARGYTTPCVPS